MLYPFAPHIAEELWEELGENELLTYAPIPPVDPQYLVDDTATYVVQINGKLRGRFDLPKDKTEEELMELVRQNPEMEKHLAGEIVKTVFVPNKLLNIVLKVILNLLIFLYFLGISPKIFFDRILKGKRHPVFAKARVRLFPTAKRNQSSGFTPFPSAKSNRPSLSSPSSKKLHRDAFFLITTTTATGQDEAKRSLSGAHAFAYLPIDLTWIVKRWVQKLNLQAFSFLSKAIFGLTFYPK